MSLIFILTIAVLALAGAAYFALGGRAIFGGKEQPDRLLGQRVQLSKIESGPRGLDPNRPPLPVAVVENFDGAMYVLQFEQPVEWLGKTETPPGSRAAPPATRCRWSEGCFTGRSGSADASVPVKPFSPFCDGNNGDT